MKGNLRELKGVGEKTEKLFEKIGVFSMEDLLHYYPRDYETYEEPSEIRSLAEGMTKSVSAVVSSPVYVSQGRSKQVITTTVSDGSGSLSVVWFHMPYLRNMLKRGSHFVFRGRIVKKQGRLTMEHPEIFTLAAYEEILHSLQPVYSLTAGLSNKTIVKLLHLVLEEQSLKREYLPEDLKERYHLADYNYALEGIHFPENQQQLLLARQRLVFDEFLLFVLAVQMLKEKTETAENTFPMKQTWTTEQVIENLPYKLTNAQMNTWHEIERDLRSQALMSRLVQGDVGSGKTILAFLAMIMTAENGYQSALMVPTEVLARQHYEGFQKLMEEQGLSYETVLLTGSNTAKEKRELYARIASGEALIVIGTHALIQEAVSYKKLALVITDEQHRFGVRQREALTTMGNPPNVLVMSATPIPRTLAIILYGYLVSSQGLPVYGTSGTGGKTGLCDLPHGRRKRRYGWRKCSGLFCPFKRSFSRGDFRWLSPWKNETKGKESDYGAVCSRRNFHSGIHDCGGGGSECTQCHGYDGGECRAVRTGAAASAPWPCRAWRTPVLLYFYAGK